MRQSRQEAHWQQRTYHPPLRLTSLHTPLGELRCLPAAIHPFHPERRRPECRSQAMWRTFECLDPRDKTSKKHGRRFKKKKKWWGMHSGRRAIGEAPCYHHLVVPQLRQKCYITLVGIQCEAQPRRPRSARSLRDHSSLLALCEHMHTQDDTLMFWHGAL